MKPRRNFKDKYKNESNVVKIKRAPGSPTKSQLRAAKVAELRHIQTKWKTLIGEAAKTWDKLHAPELARAEGNFHVLAGLVQMRYKLSREEADRQVKAFLTKHFPPQPVAAAVPAAVAPAAAAPAAVQASAA